MVTKKRTNLWIGIFPWVLAAAALLIHYGFSPWGYYWKVDPAERKLRDSVVERAETYLGVNETDDSHMRIVDLYNSQEVLPMGYTLQQSDSWCAAFVTGVAIQQKMTDIIPPECGCQRQIELFKALSRWEERDNAIPLPGDIIYYDWEEKNLFDDCTGWSDHVGIVVGTKWPFVKVIEGNKDDSVSYRYIFLNDVHIRGFGKPDYSSKKIP